MTNMPAWPVGQEIPTGYNSLAKVRRTLIFVEY